MPRSTAGPAGLGEVARFLLWALGHSQLLEQSCKQPGGLGDPDAAVSLCDNIPSKQAICVTDILAFTHPSASPSLVLQTSGAGWGFLW